MNEQIEKIINELFDNKINRKISYEYFESVLSQNNVYPFFHRENDKIVAMVMMYVINLFSRKLAVIEEVCTLSEYRNQGIGSTLVNMAIKLASKLECDCIELNVREDKPEVQQFYCKLGFYDRKNKSMRMYLKKT